MKAMEDVGVRYDGTVRNCVGDVLQFVYGEDGMDGGRVEKQPLDTVSMSDADIRRKFQWQVDSEHFGNGVLSRDIIDDVRLNASVRALLEEELQQLLRDTATLRAIFPSGENHWYCCATVCACARVLTAFGQAAACQCATVDLERTAHV